MPGQPNHPANQRAHESRCGRFEATTPSLRLCECIASFIRSVAPFGPSVSDRVLRRLVARSHGITFDIVEWFHEERC